MAWMARKRCGAHWRPLWMCPRLRKLRRSRHVVRPASSSTAPAGFGKPPRKGDLGRCQQRLSRPHAAPLPPASASSPVPALRHHVPGLRRLVILRYLVVALRCRVAVRVHPLVVLRRHVALYHLVAELHRLAVQRCHVAIRDHPSMALRHHVAKPSLLVPALRHHVSELRHLVVVTLDLLVVFQRHLALLVA